MRTDSAWTGELLDWYDRNKRELPWRETKDPYKIWVSEIMSQQTRIEAMRPYYENWMRLFPTKEALARASEDDVVKAWQGLGYYSRARNLRLGVQEVMERYGGEIPRNRKDMESLKGVGAYTAGAVLSIAYNLKEPAIDGNVLRVYARLYNIHDDIMRTAGKKKITALAEETMPPDRPGDFNQSLMDFGARVCIPKSPRCGECPIVPWCAAKAAGTETELPVRIVNKKVPVISVIVGMIRNEKGEYLLHRRPDSGLLRSMWEFPSVEVDRELHMIAKQEVAVVGSEPLATLLEELGLQGQIDPACIKRLRHVFSHRCWEMEAYEVEVTGQASGITTAAAQSEAGKTAAAKLNTANAEAVECSADWRWVKPEEFTDLPWAGPHGKLTVLCR
ncbi:MAG: A/G-specific adenine glycosylase [Veillonella sp.]|uniref:A/G-specific adenine glycosylase n=1 Tax=Veillonella sp. TaxID=1926307 RepID=UPI0025DC834D|nr:A/G-specific adenine glycosylase [Veillonella sp.]MBS4914014.1 A/G-specific adenine glycosylase [Veillonella sp.]